MAIRIARNLIRDAGGVLLSKKEHDTLLVQRDRAVAMLIDTSKDIGATGVTGIIFSRDRALQLYTLLHSYFSHAINPCRLVVLFSSSTPAHNQAYREVTAAAVGRDIEFVDDAPGFRTVLKDVLHKVATPNLFFLVDDIVFLRDFDIELAAALDPHVEILSLRHSPHLSYSYTAQQEQAPPLLAPATKHPDLLCFRWFEAGNEWSYPWSVDGHVLATDEVKVLTAISDFKAPNSYEGALASFNSLCNGRTGLCFENSVILNLPINRVQNEVGNISGDVSTEFLLDKWNSGQMIDLRPLKDHVPRSPHEEHPIHFVLRRPLPFPRRHRAPCAE